LEEPKDCARNVTGGTENCLAKDVCGVKKKTGERAKKKTGVGISDLRPLGDKKHNGLPGELREKRLSDAERRSGEGGGDGGEGSYLDGVCSKGDNLRGLAVSKDVSRMKRGGLVTYRVTGREGGPGEETWKVSKKKAKRSTPGWERRGSAVEKRTGKPTEEQRGHRGRF